MSTKMGDKLYTFPAATSVVIEGPITLNGEVTYSDPPPGVSLDDLVSLTGAGTFQAADLVATDDLTVGDDATITGTLTVGAGAAVTGAITATTSVTAADLVATDDVTVGDDLVVSGLCTIGETLAVTGNITGAATVQGADLIATDDLTVAGTASLGGGVLVVDTVATVSGTLTVSPDGTLNVDAVEINGLTMPVTVDVASLVGTGVYGVACPFAGTVVKILSRLKAPLTTGNATLTAKIGATAITDGAITITQAASAIGDIDSATPSAANTVAEGSNLSVTVGGTNDAAVGATVTFIIKRSA